MCSCCLCARAVCVLVLFVYSCCVCARARAVCSCYVCDRAACSYRECACDRARVVSSAIVLYVHAVNVLVLVLCDHAV